MNAESLARLFHDTYERLAPDYAYQTRPDSAVPWEKVPDRNRNLMIAVMAEMMTELGLEDTTARFWHAYQAEIPQALEDSLGTGMAFTVIADTPTTGKEAPDTHLGTVFGQELTFKYLTTWDHEPSDNEKEQAQLAQFQLAKEKERNDNAG